MKRLVGILLMVAVLYGVLMASDENARSWNNQETIAGRLGFYGILTLGVGVLIVSGGIDLSIGSVVGLGAVSFGLMLSGPMTERTAYLLGGLSPLGLSFAAGAWLHGRLRERPVPPWLALLASAAAGLGLLGVGGAAAYRLLFRLEAICGWFDGFLPAQLAFPLLSAAVVLWASGQIGLVHGLLVTRLRLQPFLVTLCGLFVYRGLARWASSSAVGLGVERPVDFRYGVDWIRERLVGSSFGVPQQLSLLVLLSILLGLFLHGTRHGRYLMAIGANEDAARYAGIPTERYKVLAYFLCSLLAGLGGVLTMFESRSVNATNAGSLLELYAITGAVLGGCSLRGGEGSVAGMFLGAAVLPLLRQLCNFGGISNELEYVVIGLALLLGTVVDEALKRRGARAA